MTDSLLIMQKTGNGEHILEDDIYEWCRIDEGRVE